MIKLFKGSHNSLNTRLTRLYILSILLLVTVTSIILYSIITYSLNTAVDAFIQEEIYFIKELTGQDSFDKKALAQEILIPSKKHPNDVYELNTMILDGARNVILAPDTKTAAMVIQFFSQQQIDTEYYANKISVNDRILHVVQAKIARANKLDSPVWLLLALDVTYHEKLLQTFRLIAVFIVLFACFAAFLISRKLVKINLSVFKNIASEADSITIDNLSKRLSYERWPDELNELGEAINTMLTRLENGFNQLKNSAQDMAHEIRNPINNLFTSNEIMLLSEREVSDYRELLATNLEELKRITTIIDNILFMGQIEGANNRFFVKAIHLRELIEDIFCENQEIINKKDISIEITGEGILTANPDHIKRCFINILQNALYYSKQHGYIHVTIEDKLDHVLCITVEDNGIGIKENDLPRIFERFYRGRHTQHKQIRVGSGLGLAIVKSIVELYQGNIKIKSIENEGTQVTITFP